MSHVMPIPVAEANAITGKPAYYTKLGMSFCGDAEDYLAQLPDASLNLVLTSPPFALQREKEYGNLTDSEYINWLERFARLVHKKLRDDGSFVLDIGGAYEKGKPVRSLYNFRVLIRFCDLIGFRLAEDFYWYNPAKLPSPIEWVNKRKIRAKDAVNTVWWLSKTDHPKADVTQVLTEYSDRMKTLLKAPDEFYRPKKRPSGHDIGARFDKDNGGAIPSNLLQIPNTDSNSQYLAACKALNVDPHPARFPARLPEFFIKFLTEPGDLVLDIFAGSNTTGFVAEANSRRWLSFETRREYLAASTFRFLPKQSSEEQLRTAYEQVMNDESPAL
jgi:site-specific DNA-methyltransferase (cytosine-N4-specific)